LTRFEAWSLHVSNVLVGGTGLVYAWMKYLVRPDDPYAVVNHPLQPEVQHLHVLFAPLLVFAGGMIFRRYVWARVRSGYRPRRPTGLLLALQLVPMVASGYLLQTTTDEAWNAIWVWVHVAASSLWILSYGVHLVSARPAAVEPQT